MRARRRTRNGTLMLQQHCGQSLAQVIGYLREHEITLTWDPAAAAVQARATETAKPLTAKQA